MLEQVKAIAKKIEYGSKVLAWAADCLGSFPIYEKEKARERERVANPPVQHPAKVEV